MNMHDNNIFVSILMPTYNHERFIAQAIESALAQKTQYSFELLINDDCSTDSTAKIAQEYAEKYPQIVHFFHQTQNQGLIKNYKFLFEQAKGKYIAILESDDVWHDCNNLQKKISFLEKNEDFGLIASAANIIDENGVVQRLSQSNIDNSDNWYIDLLYENPLKAVSVIFRRSLFDKYCSIDDYIEKSFLTVDYPIWLSLASHSKCKYLNEVLCSYRQIASSISNSSDYSKQLRFANSVQEIQNYILNLYLPPKNFDRNKQIFIQNKKYMELALRHHKFFDYYEYAKKLQINMIDKSEKKILFIRRFTVLFYIQHVLRGKK